RALSMNGVVVEAEHCADFIKESWLLTCWGGRHIRSRDSGLKAVIISFCIFARKPAQYHIIKAKWQVKQWFGPSSTGVERRYAPAEATVVISKIAFEFYTPTM